MTPEGDTFTHYCTCGGYAWAMNGRPEAQPHMVWCPQFSEYAEWWRNGKMTPEGRVKALVKRRLDALEKLYRFMPVQNGMGKPGLDFYLCAGGWFIAIETKAPGKKLTPRQETTKAEIEAADGLVFVVDDERSLDYAMQRIEACCVLAAEIRKPLMPYTPAED